MNNITEAFKDKTLVITGGTGSFGSTVLKHFLTTDIGEIRIISRDEKKQDWMRHTLQAQYPEYCSKVQFYVGDVRNLDSVRDVMYGADFPFTPKDVVLRNLHALEEHLENEPALMPYKDMILSQNAKRLFHR